MGFKSHLDALSQAVMGSEPDARGQVSVPYNAVRAVLLYAEDRSSSHREAHEALAARVEKLEDALKPRGGDHVSAVLTALADIAAGPAKRDRPLSEQVQGSLVAQLAARGQVRLVMTTVGNEYSSSGPSPQQLVIDRHSALAYAIKNGDPVTITAYYSPSSSSFEVTGGAGGEGR